MTRKIVQTAEHQLSVARAIIKQQEEEIDKLRLALSEPQRGTQTKKQPVLSKYTPLLRERLASNNEHNSHSHRTPQARQDVPSFARSTRASLLRQNSPPNSSGASPSSTVVPSPSVSSGTTKYAPQRERVIIHGTAHVYKDGNLLSGAPGYLRSTKATINKFGDYEQQREEREESGICYPPSVDSWRSNVETENQAATTNEHNEVIQPQQTAEIMPQAELEEKIERRRLEIHTRLSDNDWVSKRENNVHIDDDEALDILSRGERLAKRCMWRWLRTNHPKKCSSMGLHYLSNLDFGRDNLSQFYWSRTLPKEVLAHLDWLIWLRNRLHHFSGWCYGVEKLDVHLSDVQELAVLLHDEESATAARGLRDRLRREVEEVAREIETVGLLTALPFAGDYPWGPHHIILFRRIVWAYKDDEVAALEKYSAAAVQGAMEYAKRSSDMSWDCEPAMEASLAKVQRLENGGYGRAQERGWEDRDGRESRGVATTRWRSSSANGPRILFSHGKPADAQYAKRQRSLSLGTADRSMV